MFGITSEAREMRGLRVLRKEVKESGENILDSSQPLVSLSPLRCTGLVVARKDLFDEMMKSDTRASWR